MPSVRTCRVTLRIVSLVVFYVALAAALGACATAGRSGSPFPTRAEIDAMTQGSGAVSPFAQAVVDAESWSFAEPPVQRLEHVDYRDPSPWGELLTEYVAADPAQRRSSWALHCAARELGRFYLQYTALPSVSLRRAILEHCGALADAVVPQFVFGPASPEHSDAALHQVWQSQVRASLRDATSPGPRELGIAFARDERKAVVIVLSGALRVALEPVSRVVGAGDSLALRGRATIPADRIGALVNHGRYGFRVCVSDESVRPPEFSVTCPLDASDRSARIDLSAHREGRVLGESLLAVEALRDAGRQAYERERYAASELVGDPTELRSRLLELVNDVRAQAGAALLSLAPAESATSERLAPIYFQAQSEPGREVEVDVVVLGLLAGWEVDGTIREAGFTAAAVGPTRDASEWLSAVMSAPAGRAALLAPDARVAALGPVMTDSPPVIGAVFTSYALFDGADHDEVARRFVERVAAARAEIGLPAPIVVDTLEPDARSIASAVNAGSLRPSSALMELMQTGARVLGGPVRGLAFEANDVDLLPLPEELVRQKRLELSVTVTHYHPDGEPWGRYVILVLVPGGGVRA